MTMPHLMNCSHHDTGWCLECVKEEWETREAVERNFLERIAKKDARIAELEIALNGERVATMAVQDSLNHVTSGYEMQIEEMGNTILGLETKIAELETNIAEQQKDLQRFADELVQAANY